MRIKKFEDLIAWQEDRKLNKIIYENANKFIGRDKDLVRQIRRASISVMANIAEGFARYGYKDRKQFYTISRSSLAELKSHFYATLDLNMVIQIEVDSIIKQIDIVGKLVSGMIRSIAPSH
ncbi:MAG: four helix bundle protein [Elusimicrobia bacterium]|nr:four helix bundle protein [Elusimicrobiota bacterium]